MRRLLDSVPRVRLLHFLDGVLRSLPAEVREFLELSLERRDHGESSRFRIRNGAGGFKNMIRHLERACHAATLPGPKRLLDHLMLVFVTFKRFAFDVPLTGAVEQAGLSAKAFDRLRHRVLGADTQWAELEPRAQFEFALMALAETCSVPRETATEIVEQVAGKRLA